MRTGDDPSPRLVEQRPRDRVMEALEPLAGGDTGVYSCGAMEYFEQFFDFVNDDSPWKWRTWSSFTPREVEALAEVLELMNAACAATRQHLSEEELAASGWPARMEPVAASRLCMMSERGRFNEDTEEARTVPLGMTRQTAWHVP